jgi:hypothetical protein
MGKLLKVLIVLSVSEEGLESLKEWIKQDGFESLDEMMRICSGPKSRQ